MMKTYNFCVNLTKYTKNNALKILKDKNKISFQICVRIEVFVDEINYLFV